ncbi:MAG TPA: hypothetical protein VNN10_07250 [Dehalococcoidia bacterium]|jgi:DNA-binding response OmpR family regulator|nr:hypothetical protein [Dehalococcoidia bacterium]
MDRGRRSVALLGREDSLRQVLAIALRSEGFDVFESDPSCQPLPEADPDIVLYQYRHRDGDSRDTVRGWREVYPRAAIVEISFYSGGTSGGEADVVIEVPLTLDTLMRAIESASSGHAVSS